MDINEKILNDRLNIMTENMADIEERIDNLEEFICKMPPYSKCRFQYKAIVPEGSEIIQYKSNGDVERYRSLKEASNKTNLSIDIIYKCLTGVQKKAGGHRWVIKTIEDGV